jgi:hypothetical protein
MKSYLPDMLAMKEALWKNIGTLPSPQDESTANVAFVGAGE